MHLRILGGIILHSQRPLYLGNMANMAQKSSIILCLRILTYYIHVLLSLDVR